MAVKVQVNEETSRFKTDIEKVDLLASKSNPTLSIH